MVLGLTDYLITSQVTRDEDGWINDIAVLHPFQQYFSHIRKEGCCCCCCCIVVLHPQ